MRTVAAIVPTLDRPEWLERSLAALAAARPAFAAIWVADQSAGDASRALCERFGARWLHLDRRGISHARNAALPHVEAEWVAFPDDDAEVAPDVIARLADTLERHPDVAFIGAQVAFPSGAAMQPGMDGRARALAWPPDVLRTTVSPGLFVRRDWITRAGGFDERFGIGAEFPSGEESDLLFTILGAGGVGWYEPAIRVRHPDPFAIRDERAGRRRMADYGAGMGALLAKHSQGGSDAVYTALQRRLEQRALLGAAAMLLSGRFARAQQHAAAFRGRRAGWRRWFAREAAAATPAPAGVGR
jgi:glycosyltransferase involved in cell wall biosynthesis